MTGVSMTLPDEIIASETGPQPSPFQRWLIVHQDLVTRIVPLLIVAVFVAIGVIFWVTGRFEVDSVGLAGVWFFSFIGAASIFVPIPGLAAVCVAASPAVGLNPITVGIVAGSAEALGEFSGYLAGMGGRSLFERNRFYPRVRELLIRRGGWILFFGSIIPNPLFDVVGIAAGSILYPVKKFFVLLLISKTIKSTGVAYACFWGITWIQDLAN